MLGDNIKGRRNMNKIQMIDAVADTLNVSRREASESIDCVFGMIKECLQKGEEVNVGGFGAFKVKERAERIGVNPKTKEKITIEASRSVSFRPSKTLKDLLNV